MPGHEASITIARPVADVFAYMNDVSREKEWQPQLLEAEQTPPGPARPGTRRRYVSEFMGKRLENTYVVEVYEENARLVCESTPDSTIQARTDVLWEEVSDGTRVTMAMEGKAAGVLRFVPRKLIASTFEKEVSGALARLKERLESGA